MLLPVRRSRRCSASRLVPVAVLLALLFLTPTYAQQDPIIETCAVNWCNTVVTILEPCGGGATNSSLQQSLTFTVTPLLGSCQCNSQFYNAFSQCLSCIANQAKSSPDIDNQQNWVANCKTYGFDYTNAPVNYTPPITGGDTSSGSGGLSKGGIAGVVIAVLVGIAALAGGIFLFRKKKRTKGSIFQRPYTATGSAEYTPAATQPSFNAYSNYHDAAYPETHHPYTDSDQPYYDNQDFGSKQNDDTMMMNNLRHSNYIPPPVPMSSAAVVAVGSLGSPRPSDQLPQSLRSKHNDWESRQYDYSSDLISTDHLLQNDKAVYNEGDELEPPRARDRFVNDRDDHSGRRSVTPPRSNMQSYRDEFTRPNFDPEPRRNSSDRGSVTGLNLIRGAGGYDSNDEEDRDNTQESAEDTRRRRAAELFSAEGTRR
ncbi:hypothetical protein BGZ65_007356 [Modicella reniformis]|uniref:Uncharacterized protein n=1 Tax=Modicella reniformis TaxID=1440133 RepID=A0A9P6LTN9_9FUNG|nr:hypothetical protein BGZ65_007356 [Modicella reniformis]